MTKSIGLIIFSFFFGIFPAFAQLIYDDASVQGGVLWERIQAEEVGCQNLSEQDFYSLGVFFLSLIGDTPYGEFDATLQRQMDSSSYIPLLTVIGKRFSSCDVTAPLSLGEGSFSPMQDEIETKNFSRASLLVGMQIIVVIWITFVVVSVLVAIKLLAHCMQIYFLFHRTSPQTVQDKASSTETNQKLKKPRKKKRISKKFPSKTI